MGQKEYEAAIEATAFKAGVAVERERVRELLNKWCNHTLEHEDFMREFDNPTEEGNSAVHTTGKTPRTIPPD